MIDYKIGHVKTRVTLKQFKDGCMNVNINCLSVMPSNLHQMIVVTVVFGGEYSVNDLLFALAQTVDALNYQYPNNTMHLRMPYIPYARQDRPCNAGEAFSLKRLGVFVNDLQFQTVSVIDPHSTVSNGVIDRMYVSDQYAVFSGVKNYSNTYIVAADQGALKKCEDFAKRVGAKGVITCVKSRDPVTMEINGVRIIDDVPQNAELLILDDLIDGGRTYIELARQLKCDYNPALLELAASHGLFTYGVECVADQFDKVYTTNSYTSNKESTKVKVIDVLN